MNYLQELVKLLMDAFELPIPWSIVVKMCAVSFGVLRKIVKVIADRFRRPRRGRHRAD
jgi:hypothetical protein